MLNHCLLRYLINKNVDGINQPLVDGYFGYLIGKITGNKPTFLQLTKRVATESFHFIIPIVTSNSNGM